MAGGKSQEPTIRGTVSNPSSDSLLIRTITPDGCPLECSGVAVSINTSVISNEEFRRKDGNGQYQYLKGKLDESENMTCCEKGTLAKNLRGLRNDMKLGELFEIDMTFMNETLRDFLNLKENGTNDYEFNEMAELGFEETVSWGAAYRQYHVQRHTRCMMCTDSPCSGRKSNYLNAKFTNSKDGREVVFKYVGRPNRNAPPITTMVKEYPDKGTYNYVNSILDSAVKFLCEPCAIVMGKHVAFDVKPWEDYMSHKYPRIIDTKNQIFYSGVVERVLKNSKIWDYMDKFGRTYSIAIVDTEKLYELAGKYPRDYEEEDNAYLGRILAHYQEAVEEQMSHG